MWPITTWRHVKLSEGIETASSSECGELVLVTTGLTVPHIASGAGITGIVSRFYPNLIRSRDRNLPCPFFFSFLFVCCFHFFFLLETAALKTVRTGLRRCLSNCARAKNSSKQVVRIIHRYNGGSWSTRPSTYAHKHSRVHERTATCADVAVWLSWSVYFLIPRPWDSALRLSTRSL